MAFDKVGPRSMDFLSRVAAEPHTFDQLALTLIEEMEMKNLLVPDFEESFEWLNTSAKLSIKGNLTNKICVYDFFTYCCINCMHVLPDLHALEEKFSIEDGIAVVGVHSAKFQNEKLLTNILSAVLRYNICHPVVNDATAVLWNEMSITCWPTFVIVSPQGKALLYLVGEGHRETLLKFVEVAKKYYENKGLLKAHSLPIKLAKDFLPRKVLNFPGKLAVIDGGIAISDTGHHQIVVLDMSGVVTQRIGCGEAGYEDGSLDNAKFNAPQGLAWYLDNLFVADTENHVVRQVDLTCGQVTTITGTGKQGTDKEGGGVGVAQDISSPWDVLLAPSPGCSDLSVKDFTALYIAMAGTHQIWCYCVGESSWLKNGKQSEGTCLRLAGSGNEENRNNSYPHKAAFAQPSGLTWGIVKDKHVLYVADSESSSIRIVDILSGGVKGVVGGERDPMNLFAYGDVDGKGVDAKLQHPLAVAFNSSNGLIYVADSYNHKIKVIDSLKMTCTTLCGSGTPGFQDGTFSEAMFNEPGGLQVSADCKLLYVADTNNHEIRIVDLEAEKVTTLNIIDEKSIENVTVGKQNNESVNNLSTFKSLIGRKAVSIKKEAFKRWLTEAVNLIIRLELDSGLEFTHDVESKYQVYSIDDNDEKVVLGNGTIAKDGYSCPISVALPQVSSDLSLIIELLLYVCTADKTCLMKSYSLEQPIVYDLNSSKNDVPVMLTVTL